MALTEQDLQPQFIAQVSSRPGGKWIRRCFDCGTCTGVCPISESGTGFDPRKILHMIKMGLKDQVLSSPMIWHCTHCDTCAFVCPQEIKFSHVAEVLRDMAMEQGFKGIEEIEKWGTAPCKASCPAHISIQGFIGAISQGRYREGLKLIKEAMPFPGICGRVCPHPCETDCNRAGVDKPVAIEFLKRFLADQDLSSGHAYIPEKQLSKKEKVAVIGAGPSGLTVAYYLAIKGYELTVYEKLPVAGGMMAVGIPEFRLPREVLQAEIALIKRVGVDIRLNQEIGRDIRFEELKKSYQAVFVGIGCHCSMKLGIPGEEDFGGVTDGLRFLRECNLGHLPKTRGKLVIIGGGNTAVDCARVGKRLGYQEVSILYRRTREEMPASPWEVDDTLEEEIQIHYLTAPIEITGNDGMVSGVNCLRMTLGEPDGSGRRRPIPMKGSEFFVPGDLIVTAIGQSPDLTCFPPELGMGISKYGLVVADANTGATNIPGIFSGGDVVSGPRTIVEAVAFGKAASVSIDLFLQGKDVQNLDRPYWKGIDLLPVNEGRKERELMPRLSLPERMRSFKEVDLGFNEEQAKSEAERCLRICGIQNPP